MGTIKVEHCAFILFVSQFSVASATFCAPSRLADVVADIVAATAAAAAVASLQMHPETQVPGQNNLVAYALAPAGGAQCSKMTWHIVRRHVNLQSDECTNVCMHSSIVQRWHRGRLWALLSAEQNWREFGLSARSSASIAACMAATGLPAFTASGFIGTLPKVPHASTDGANFRCVPIGLWAQLQVPYHIEADSLLIH